jgi:hypothetical protein
MIDYDNTSEMEINMYDLYKKIFGYILYEVSDEAFDEIMNNDEIMDVFLDSTGKMIMTYIINPTTEYITGNEFMTSAIMALYEDFSEEDFEGLTDADLENILEVYYFDAFSEVLYAYSEQYTDMIVDTMVEALNG